MANAININYTGDLPHYVLERLFDNFMDKSYLDVDYRNNVNDTFKKLSCGPVEI